MWIFKSSFVISAATGRTDASFIQSFMSRSDSPVSLPPFSFTYFFFPFFSLPVLSHSAFFHLLFHTIPLHQMFFHSRYFFIFPSLLPVDLSLSSAHRCVCSCMGKVHQSLHVCMRDVSCVCGWDDAVRRGC